MAQATRKNTTDSAALPPHYALDEFKQGKLATLTKALNGLATLAHDGAEATARDTVDMLAREDLSAIFTVIADQLKELSEDLPFVGRTVN